MKSISNCIVCEKPLSGKQRSFCSHECKNEHFLSYDVIKTRALERKSKLVDSLGGACLRCGYIGSLDALSFYNKNGKTLHINTNVLANSNYGKLEKKLANAQVLCRNCYEEIQNPMKEDCFHLRSLATDGQVVPRNDEKFEKKFEKKFDTNLVHCGLKPGQTVVLGVSGGVDSITMLDLFTKSKLNIKIIVAHMNHGLREEAILDEKLVSDLAKKHGFRFVSKTIKPPKVGNLEENLRNKRRDFLLQVTHANRSLQGPALLALAHNADDQAETFIMNAVRGSGSAGLGAMSMSEDKLIRPLLNFSRQEIESYARQNKLRWNEDVTNKDTSYSRNYVRHRILPLLERLNPEYLSAIHRTTHLQRQLDEHLKEEALYVIARSRSDVAIPLIKNAKDCFVPHNDDKLSVSVQRLRRLDKPLLYEVLGLLYEEVKGNRQNLSLTHLHAIEILIKSSAGTKSLDLPGSIVAKRSYDMLYFCTKKVYNMPSQASTKKLYIGKQRFGDWKVSVTPCHPCEGEDLLQREHKRSLGLRPGMTMEKTRNDTFVIDAESLPNLFLRNRKPGDKIASLGTTGTKKLQDLFVDAKIDRVKRTSWPVIEDTTTQNIVWVPGLAKAKINTNSKNLLKIKIVEAKYETIKEK